MSTGNIFLLQQMMILLSFVFQTVCSFIDLQESYSFRTAYCAFLMRIVNQQCVVEISSFENNFDFRSFVVHSCCSLLARWKSPNSCFTWVRGWKTLQKFERTSDTRPRFQAKHFFYCFAKCFVSCVVYNHIEKAESHINKHYAFTQLFWRNCNFQSNKDFFFATMALCINECTLGQEQIQIVMHCHTEKNSWKYSCSPKRNPVSVLGVVILVKQQHRM